MNYVLNTINIDCLHEYGLKISQCGMLTALGKVNSVPHIYDNYVLSFVINGEGTYTIDGVLHNVKAGDAFLTAPNAMTNWTTNDENPIQYIFMVISGPDHLKILHNVGLGTKSKIFNYIHNNDNSITNYLFSLYNTSKSTPTNMYELLGYFYLIMDYLAQKYRNTKFDTITPQNMYFNKSISFINDNYANKITILDIANFLNIDRSYLYKIFKNEAGISPIQYLNNYRLEKARQMIPYSDFSITNIADAVGYYDYSHFCHAFQKKYGLTPGEFRKQTQKA